VDRASSEQLATSVGTHAVVIRGLLKSLKDAGLIRATEGRGGGVSLARPAAKIDLREIYLAVEAENILVPNARPEFKSCPVSRSMKKIMSGVYKDVDRVVGAVLQNSTLQDVVDQVG
jgi:DNA-binding IscR family transcriptional regulator